MVSAEVHSDMEELVRLVMTFDQGRAIGTHTLRPGPTQMNSMARATAAVLNTPTILKDPKTEGRRTAILMYERAFMTGRKEPFKRSFEGFMLMNHHHIHVGDEIRPGFSGILNVFWNEAWGVHKRSPIALDPVLTESALIRDLDIEISNLDTATTLAGGKTVSYPKETLRKSPSPSDEGTIKGEEADMHGHPIPEKDISYPDAETISDTKKALQGRRPVEKNKKPTQVKKKVSMKYVKRRLKK